MSQTFHDIVHDVSSRPSLTDDQRHQLLESARRRFALQILRNERDGITLGRLAREIAKREDGVDHADEEAVDRIACALHHCHLPMMAQTGVLSYDPDTHRVTVPNPAGRR